MKTGGIIRALCLDNQHKYTLVLYTNIDQIPASSLHGLLNCELGGLD